MQKQTKVDIHPKIEIDKIELYKINLTFYTILYNQSNLKHSMEDFNQNTIFVGKDKISMSAIKKYYGFRYIQDVRKIVAKAIRCDLALVPNQLNLTTGKVISIVAGIQEWQSSQEAQIMKHIQTISIYTTPVVFQDNGSYGFGWLSSRYLKLSMVYWSRAIDIHPDWFILQKNNSSRHTYVLKKTALPDFIEFIDRQSANTQNKMMNREVKISQQKQFHDKYPEL